jgi:hypothetical protein
MNDEPESIAAAKEKIARVSAEWRAQTDAYALNILPVIEELKATGMHSYRGIARCLNERGIRTILHCKWHGRSVRNLLFRLDEISRCMAGDVAHEAQAGCNQQTGEAA